MQKDVDSQDDDFEDPLFDDDVDPEMLASILKNDEKFRKQYGRVYDRKSPALQDLQGMFGALPPVSEPPPKR